MNAPAAEGTALEIHDVDYPAVNCRAGIFAGVLRARWDIGLAPLFLRLPVAARDVVGPIESGEIAGFTFGSLEDAVWTELFGASFVTWHPGSRREMDDTLAEAMAEHRFVLSAQDGYWNPQATDKYQRRHMRHNVLLHGRSGDGGAFLVADRAYRSSMDADTLWRCMEDESATFVAITGASPNRSAGAELVAEALERLRAALDSPLDDPGIARISSATAADLLDAENRWQQSHFFLNGVGRSRALFARALRETQAAGDRDEPGDALLADLLDRAAAAWVLAGRFVYKRLMAGRAAGEEELASRIHAAQEADAGALQAIGAKLAPSAG